MKTMQNCDDRVDENNNRSQTPAEWRFNSYLELGVAENHRQATQRLAVEADRLIDRTNESVLKNEWEVGHRAKLTIKDVEYKRDEIDRQKSNVDEEIQLLFGYQKRVENVIKNFSGEALDAVTECLRLRKCRMGIDMIFDDVEKELLRERQLILDVQDQLEDLFEQIVLQIRKLRIFYLYLDNDFNCKLNTLKIENQNATLNENNVDLSVLNDKTVIKPAEISLTEWNRFTSNMILEANQVLVEARPVRLIFDQTFSKMVNDLTTQAETVNKAFRFRVADYQDVIEKLKHQKVEAAKDVVTAAQVIDKLRAAVAEKDKYIALVRARLLNRARRQGVDLCRDELEVKLSGEMAELTGDVRKMETVSAECFERHRRLGQSIVRIDLQLGIKENSLRIDDVLCGEQRKRVNYKRDV